MVVVLCLIGVVVTFLLLVVLALMREIVLLRSEVAAVSALVKNPPPPSFIGEQAPDALRRVIAAELPGDSSGQQLVAFVTPSCGPCESLADGIGAAISEGRIVRDDVLFVIWALPHSGWERWSRRLSARAVPDIDGRLARACEVRGTPAVFVVSRTSWLVLDYNMKGDVEWAVSRLTEPMTQPPTGATA